MSAQLGTCSPPPYLPCVSARHLLCPSFAFPTSFCHLCLRKVSCALPQHVISPSLPLASMCAVYNIPFKHSCLRHTWRPPQTSSLAFPTCLRHACLPDAWLAFVFLQAWQSPHANLQPAARVPIVSARRLVRLSLAFPGLCPLYPPNVLFVSPQFHSYFAFPTCGCHSCL